MARRRSMLRRQSSSEKNIEVEFIQAVKFLGSYKKYKKLCRKAYDKCIKDLDKRKEKAKRIKKSYKKLHK